MNTFSIFLFLIAIVCFLLIVVIMVQNPKGGGLDSSLGGSTVISGVKNTNNFLDKSTWTLGGLLICLVLLSGISFNGGFAGDSKILDENTVVTPSQPILTEEVAAPADTTTTEEAPVSEEDSKN